MPRLDRHSLLFSANCFAAAMLAAYVALAVGLPRPYWAMSTAYIVSQPLAGAVRSKAVYRLLGTLVGGIAAVALVPTLANSPALLSIALALWVGACLTVSLMDRSPASYVVMLAGYTAALIGFPSVDHPEAIFDTAVARAVEIGLGILSATLVHSLVFPRSVDRTLEARLDRWLGEARRWMADLGEGAPAGAAARDRRHLAVAAGEIHALSAHLPFDTARPRDAAATVAALHDRMLMLIPRLSGAADRLEGLKALGGPPADLAALLAETGRWAAGGAPLAQGRDLAARLQARSEASAGDWAGLLVQSLTLRLSEAVTAMAEAQALLVYFRDPTAPRSAAAVGALEAAGKRPQHIDLGLAIRSGATAATAILAVCALWIATGWPDGAVAAMMAAVFCCFFAALDDPAPQIANFGLFALLALPLSAFYLFAVLPAVSGFPLLALVLAPPLLVMGLYVADARTAASAVAAVITFITAIGLQQSFTPDFAGFANGNLAQFVGLFVAIAVTRTLRSMSVETSVRRIMGLTWAGVARLARARGAPEPGAFAARLIDRLALLAPKLARQGERPDDLGEAALADLRVAMNVVGLQQSRPGLDGPGAERLDALLAALARHYAEQGEHGRRPPPAEALAALDQALADLAPEGEPARPMLAELVGLRRNLFPAAAPPTLRRAA